MPVNGPTPLLKARAFTACAKCPVTATLIKRLESHMHFFMLFLPENSSGAAASQPGQQGKNKNGENGSKFSVISPPCRRYLLVWGKCLSLGTAIIHYPQAGHGMCKRLVLP